MATLDDAIAQAQANNDLEDSIEIVIDQLIAQDTDYFNRLKAAGQDPVKIQQVLDLMAANNAKVTAKKQAIMDAIQANTESPPTP